MRAVTLAGWLVLAAVVGAGCAGSAPVRRAEVVKESAGEARIDAAAAPSARESERVTRRRDRRRRVDRHTVGRCIGNCFRLVFHIASLGQPKR